MFTYSVCCSSLKKEGRISSHDELSLSFVSGLFPEEFEEFDRLAMGEDVQEAQKLSMDAAGGEHDGWKEGQNSIGGCV